MRDSSDRWPRWVYGVGEEPDARFSLANERTFLAWIRTGLALIGAGVALIAVGTLSAEHEPAAALAAGLLIAGGIGCGVTGFVRWAGNERRLRLRAPLPASVMMPVLVAVLVSVGLTALFFALPGG
ncbi:YidH family protein [Skermania piniformis]|uniref:YidH family protein n=1 Tax=Skermania pinensis TaxID=39122 RepID=UPI0008314DD0|nr:DUF202 domain-containing protein [Skermania piniformis]